MATGDKAVRCDQCEKTFVIQLAVTPTDDGGERWSFACPHCQAVTVAANITDRGVTLRRQLEGVRGQLQKFPADRNLLARRDRLAGLLEQEVSP